MADKTEKKKKGFFAGVKGAFARFAKYFRDTRSEVKKGACPDADCRIADVSLVCRAA